MNSDRIIIPTGKIRSKDNHHAIRNKSDGIKASEQLDGSPTTWQTPQLPSAVFQVVFVANGADFAAIIPSLLLRAHTIRHYAL